MLALALIALVLAPSAAGATEPPRAVRLLLVPGSSWQTMPPIFDGWAKASLAISVGEGDTHRPLDSYRTISKGARLGDRYSGHEGDLERVLRAAGIDASTVVRDVGTDALPSAVYSAGDACVIVASSSMPAGQHLGAIAVSPQCGLGTRTLVSASTRQAGYVVTADLQPTLLRLLGVDDTLTNEASPMKASGPSLSVHRLIERDDRARVAADAIGWFTALAIVAGLAVLVTRRHAVALVALALPVSMLLADAVPWWRGGVVAGLAVSAGIAVAIALALRRSDAVLVITVLTVVALGLDAATGGHLALDSGIANNAIGAGRFTGMGNVPYGFFLASFVIAGALALDRWGRRAALPLAAAAAVAVIVDGAPFLGADVGGVLAAVPAFAALLVRSRRRLVAVALGGVAVLGAFAAVDLSRPVGSRTHLGRTLAGGNGGSTFVRRELAALHSFYQSPWVVVVLVALVGLYLLRDRLPLRRALVALAVGAFLGTFLNDSGVAVAGAMAAVAWPAYALLSAPAAGGTAARPRRSRPAGSAT